ncbi:MAG TPA: hypothetical protein VJT09_18390 [Pyrinomonadaceae bacterium]|nr:hypothetical protein [Pyrinomonadaceae bacterium]
MSEYKKFFSKIIASALLLALVASDSYGMKRKQLVVIGRVIGVEVPETGWPMEFESVKIFYIRVERVLKGKSTAKYIRIAYGYNPSSAPQYILPIEMFDGKTRWKFDLSEYSAFDAKVAVSKSEGDWIDTKNSKKIKGSEILPENDPRRNEEFTSVPIITKCVPVAGFEKEAAILETLGVVKGYWLDFERKGFEKTTE